MINCRRRSPKAATSALPTWPLPRKCNLPDMQIVPDALALGQTHSGSTSHAKILSRETWNLHCCNPEFLHWPCGPYLAKRVGWCGAIIRGLRLTSSRCRAAGAGLRSFHGGSATRCLLESHALGDGADVRHEAIPNRSATLSLVRTVPVRYSRKFGLQIETLKARTPLLKWMAETRSHAPSVNALNVHGLRPHQIGS